MSYADFDVTIQRIRFELYRENIGGALDIAEAAHAAHPDPRYKEQADRIRGWLEHLGSREAYIAPRNRNTTGCAGARG